MHTAQPPTEARLHLLHLRLLDDAVYDLQECGRVGRQAGRVTGGRRAQKGEIMHACLASSAASTAAASAAAQPSTSAATHGTAPLKHLTLRTAFSSASLRLGLGGRLRGPEPSALIRRVSIGTCSGSSSMHVPRCQRDWHRSLHTQAQPTARRPRLASEETPTNARHPHSHPPAPCRALPAQR